MQDSSKSGAKNVIVRYSETNGVKLTILLPMLHNLIKSQLLCQAVQEQESADVKLLLHSLVLTHSSLRSAEIEEFANDAIQFCNEIVTVVNLDDGDLDDVLETLAEAIKKAGMVPGVEASSEIKNLGRSLFLVGTPARAAQILKKLTVIEKQHCEYRFKNHSIMLDKSDLLLAMEFKEELNQVSELVKMAKVKQFGGKTVITTNVKDEKDQTAED